MRPTQAKTRLGFIPDRPFVYEKLTGGEFLHFVAGLYGQDGDTVDRGIDELLEMFELSIWKDELVESRLGLRRAQCDVVAANAALATCSLATAARN